MMERAEKLIANSTFRKIIIGILALMAAVSVFKGAQNAILYSQDFQWDASKALAMRINPYEISLTGTNASDYAELSEFYRLFTDKGLTQKMEANQFPSLLLLLFPYTFFRPFAARIFWLVSNLFFTAGIIWLLCRTFLKDIAVFERTVIILLMLAGTPFRNQLGVGQHTLFSFFFFLLAVWLDEKKPSGNTAWITVSLFICYFKYTLTAPLVLYFIYRKRYREVAISIVAHVAVNIAAAFWLGISVMDAFVLPLKVSSLLSAEGGIDLGVLLGGGVLSMLVGGFTALVLFAFTSVMPKGKEYILYPLLITWALILTYHRTYDFFVLSSIPVLFQDRFKEDVGEKLFGAIRVHYWILIILVYFGFRLFNENTVSKLIIGGVYYAFAVMLGFCTVLIIRKREFR